MQKVTVALQMQHYYAHSASFPANLYQRTVARYDLDYHHEVYISPRAQDVALQQERVLVQDASTCVANHVVLSRALSHQSKIAALHSTACTSARVEVDTMQSSPSWHACLTGGSTPSARRLSACNPLDAE